MAAWQLTEKTEDMIDARKERDCVAEAAAWSAALTAALALAQGRPEMIDALLILEECAGAWQMCASESGYRLGCEVGGRTVIDALRVARAAAEAARC